MHALQLIRLKKRSRIHVHSLVCKHIIWHIKDWCFNAMPCRSMSTVLWQEYAYSTVTSILAYLAPWSSWFLRILLCFFVSFFSGSTKLPCWFLSPRSCVSWWGYSKGSAGDRDMRTASKLQYQSCVSWAKCKEENWKKGSLSQESDLWTIITNLLVLTFHSLTISFFISCI